jgi:hypothetical protein
VLIGWLAGWAQELRVLEDQVADSAVDRQGGDDEGSVEVRRLLSLSTVMPSDEAFARQARRKFVLASADVA